MAISEKKSLLPDEWESGKLGRDSHHAKRSGKAFKDELDRALDLQMISIRLQKKLINDLKLIAQHHGIGYQPLVRNLLHRFVTSEKKQILQAQLKALGAEKAKQKAASTNNFVDKEKKRA